MNAGLNMNEYIILFIAFLTSFLVGLLAIKYLLKLARKYTLNAFAIYRFVLAAFLIVYFYL